MFRKELSKAEVEFKKIIDKEGSLFGLMENWADNFDGMHKNNKESLLRFSLPETVQADSMNITCLPFIGTYGWAGCI